MHTLFLVLASQTIVSACIDPASPVATAQVFAQTFANWPAHKLAALLRFKDPGFIASACEVWVWTCVCGFVLCVLDDEFTVVQGAGLFIKAPT